MHSDLKIKTDPFRINTSRDSIALDINPEKGDDRKIFFGIFLSFLFYLTSFYIFYFLKEEALYLYGDNFKIFGIIIFSLTFGAFFSQKFKILSQNKNERSIIPIVNSFIISLISITILVYSFKITNNNWDYVLISLFCGLVFEAYYYLLFDTKRKSKISFVEYKKLSVKYLLIDGLILTFFCYFGILRPLFSVQIAEKELVLLGVVYISWLISAATTHKFIPTLVSFSKWNAFKLQVKFYLRILALTVISIIFLNLMFETAIIFINAFVGYSIVSSVVSMFLFASKIENKTDESTVVFLKAYEMNEQTGSSSRAKNGNSKYSFKNTEPSESVVKQKLQFEYLKDYGEVFSVLDSMLDLASFDTRKSLIIKSDEPNDVPIKQQPDSYHLLVNLHVLNDQRDLNNYILDVKRTLVKGGVFVGALLPHHYRYRRFLKEHSFWMANTLYFFDFIWKRVFPKLPIAREIYFTFSKEKDRALSLAEGLGRLVYCGFKIIDLAAVDDVVYFAVVKNGGFQPVKKFFYSPIFKMQRLGKDGKPIFVYKLRTMYPYSEFIQDFVYSHNKLDTGGKFKDDFRVPVWGKLFRKLWIDELPMLINWAKRDLKFVGVRPISNHYLSLYSREHQERRKKFKPGLIPPFYADMPETLEEIEYSEKRYLDSYEKNPYKTDVKYFFKAVKNILIDRKRSA
ncbi:MAG: sugar transferase [Ignavibacteriaceae bacterium]